jgi:uncharacterized protein YndB with AHSA1/START domain
MSVVLDRPVEKVFELWTTVAGIKSFFAEDARIELKAGGAYEIYFLPRSNPESDANSTRGAKLLHLEKNRTLVFEWTAPPFAAELNINPLPTWVEVNLKPLHSNPNKSQLTLSHFGFKRVGKWTRVYEFFVRNWSAILFRLDLICAKKLLD